MKMRHRKPSGATPKLKPGTLDDPEETVVLMAVPDAVYGQLMELGDGHKLTANQVGVRLLAALLKRKHLTADLIRMGVDA